MSQTRELLEMRLKKFLHYGSELPIYQPGDRFFYKAYTRENIPSLLKLIEEDNPESIMDIILKVKKEGRSMWPDAITFALAVCAQQTTSQKLQVAAYSSVQQICKTARDIVLFVKFFTDLKGSRGGGSGFKRAVSQWYLVWAPFDLAEILISPRKYFGWGHKDVLRICHVNPISPEQKLLITYARMGVKEAIKKYSGIANEQVTELLEYLNSVESFRKLKDPKKVAKAIAAEMHTIDRVPTEMLNHQKVWIELIPHMDVETLLDNFQRISSLGMLKDSNTEYQKVTIMKVNEVFNNVNKAANFKQHPTRVYIEYMKYKKAAIFRLDLALKKNPPVSIATPEQKPPKPSLLVESTLLKFFLSLYKRRTVLRYLVAVDIRPKMFTDRCFHSTYLTPIEGATAIAFSIMRIQTSENVKIGTFMNDKGTIELIDVNEASEISDYESKFERRTSEAGPASVREPIRWARKNEVPIDVFVVLSNFTVNTKKIRKSINGYRTRMKLPNTKVITCSLNGKITTHKQVEGRTMQFVVGFDEYTCRHIEAFACGAF